MDNAPDLKEAAEHSKRSDELADKLRTFLVAVNTGAIGVTFAVAGALASHKVPPAWTVLPIASFVAGLVVAAVSMFLAQHREIKRRDAAKLGQQLPDFSALYWRSSTWNYVSLALFVGGVVAGLCKLQALPF